MRKPLAKLMISGVIVAIGSSSSGPAAFGQGFLKRLQDRVQSLDEQNSGTQNPVAAESADSRPRAGGQRGNQRRPLVDALLQYGPEIFGGQGISEAAPLGTQAERGPASGVAPYARRTAQFQKASLGIDVLDSAPGVPGVLVTGFRSESKADDAGLQKNDVIVSLDQTLTPKIADIARFLSVRRAGESVTARVLRGDQMKTINIPLLGPQQVDVPTRREGGASMPKSSIATPLLPGASEPRPLTPRTPVQGDGFKGSGGTETLPIAAGQVETLPTPITQPSTGLSINTGIQRYGILLGSGSRLRGALVDGVVSGSAADVAGIKPADRVVSVDGVLTHDAMALIRELEHLTQGTVASLGVVRGDSYVSKAMALTTEIKSEKSAFGKQLKASAKQPSAAAENSDAAENSAAAEKMETETGVLEGIGSVLGGLFGGSGKPTGKVQVERVPQNPKDKLKASGPAQTSFDPKGLRQPKKMVGDPPSLNGLPVKPKSEPAANVPDSGRSEQTAAEMREEIRQLREKLKQMEQRSQLDDEAVQKDPVPTSKPE